MCRAAKCRVCGKTTWAGCGNHVEAVKAGVPAGQWCGGHVGGPGEPTPRRRSLFGKRGQDT